jgi:hypothetical protein
LKIPQKKYNPFARTNFLPWFFQEKYLQADMVVRNYSEIFYIKYLTVDDNK